jgi:predicted amidohydrolase
MRVHVLQIAYDDREPVAERVERVSDLVRRQAGADLVVLPELWAPGGFSYRTWAERAESVDGPTVTAVAAAARDLGAVVHAGSIVERAAEGSPDRGADGRGLWNTSVVVGPDGGVLATYRKIHRFGFGQGEPVLLEAGEDVVTVELPVPGRGTGEPDAGAGASAGTRTAVAGLATCYDLRFPELFRRLVDAGARLVLLPAAWPAARVEAWRLLGRARAIENQLVLVQCNTAGTHAGVPMGGYSQLVDARGDVIAEAGPDGESVLAVDVDLDEVDAWREAFPVLADRRL